MTQRYSIHFYKLHKLIKLNQFVEFSKHRFFCLICVLFEVCDFLYVWRWCDDKFYQLIIWSVRNQMSCEIYIFTYLCWKHTKKNHNKITREGKRSTGCFWNYSTFAAGWQMINSEDVTTNWSYIQLDSVSIKQLIELIVYFVSIKVHNHLMQLYSFIILVAVIGYVIQLAYCWLT